MSVSDFLSTRAQGIIQGLQGSNFSSRDFIWALMTNYERQYIQLLEEDRSEHPIWNVHKQIGRYLSDHSVQLGITSLGYRDPSVSPFGNDSSTMMWSLVGNGVSATGRPIGKDSC